MTQATARRTGAQRNSTSESDRTALVDQLRKLKKHRQEDTGNTRDGNSGTFDTFRSLVRDANDVALAGDAQRFESSSELSDRVAAVQNGIGSIGLPYVRNETARH